MAPLVGIEVLPEFRVSPEARAALGVRGWNGPNDSRAASRIFGEGFEII